jgi:Raf kinase inhibitor-like YbhB/YbcL family protein
MGKFFTGFVGLIMIGIGVFYYYKYSPDSKFSIQELISPGGTIKVTSQDFVEGERIPKKFTCEGADFSPTFFINTVPIDAKSLVFIMEDVSAKPNPVTHWINYNINPDITLIESSKVLGIAYTGVNDFGNRYYDGPCPTLSDTRKYTFRVIALDTIIDTPDIKRFELERAMKGHILATGYISGVYSNGQQ